LFHTDMQVVADCPSESGDTLAEVVLCTKGHTLLLLPVVGFRPVYHIPGSNPGLHPVCQLLKVGVNLGQLSLDLHAALPI
jgi:hypothetical protein